MHGSWLFSNPVTYTVYDSMIITTQNGCTALYVAAQSGYTKTVNELISKGAHLDIPTRVSNIVT